MDSFAAGRAQPFCKRGRELGVVTPQGDIQQNHLDRHLDEFTFRFNRRRSNARGWLFHRLAQQAIAVDPAPYNSIVGYAQTKKST